MENIDTRIEVLEKMVEDLILKLGRANHRIFKLTQRLDSLEQDSMQFPQHHYDPKVVSL